MYRSCLLIDVGADPDRPRPGRQWLRNLYRVHQRLSMAFPSRQRAQADPHFLQPWDPADFPEQRHLADRSKRRGEIAADVLRPVHAQRDERAGFLFRIDPHPGGKVVIVVQSATEPNWDYAFHNANHLLRCAPQVWPSSPAYALGETLPFRLVANPTKRACHGKWERKRVPVPTDDLEDWLAHRAGPAGFRVAHLAGVQPGFVYANKTRCPSKGQRLRSVRYEGLLEVTDPARFGDTLIRGIGPAKAFGFGLLSVAPVR